MNFSENVEKLNVLLWVWIVIKRLLVVSVLSSKEIERVKREILILKDMS